MAQLDTTIGAVYVEDSSTHLSELVGKVPLRTSAEDKAEGRQYSLTLSECTMLDFQQDWFGELAGCCDPEDRADEA